MRIIADDKRREDVEMQRGLLKGDEEALERFYEKYFSRLYRYIYYRVQRSSTTPSWRRWTRSNATTRNGARWRRG
jgi:hypothetical protein